MSNDKNRVEPREGENVKEASRKLREMAAKPVVKAKKSKSKK